jgi:rhodanese-related sulfurtransferase
LRSTWAVSGHEVMLGPSTAAERERLDPDRTYVCFCLHGTRSRWVAERLRADGFRAFAFDGGMTALTRRLAEAPDADDGAAARPTVTAAGGV